MSDTLSTPALSQIAMTGTPLTDTITWAPGLDDNVITVYFAPQGQSVPGPLPFGDLRNVVSEGFNDYEIGQFMTAFAAVEAVINVEFVIVTNPAQADLTLVLDTNEVQGTFLGVFNPPGTRNEGIGIFDGSSWDRTPGGDLEEGGFGYVTIVHELLHGLGLAHPHDNGGGSTIMPGLNPNSPDFPFGHFANNDLNQGVYTTMSYNSGWLTGPNGTAPSASQPGINFGFEAGPMAIDIGALQAIYGANTTYAAGNNLYLLDATNGVRTYWSSIWDTGGIDEIRHTGAAGATIDLRAATLQFEEGGGGYVSQVAGVAGGFTIANGVVIENATGGNGADRITGNDAGNLIQGNSGNDTLLGGFGNDTLNGGAQNDRMLGGEGVDSLVGSAGFDTLNGDGGNDILDGGTNADNIFGGAGNDTMRGGDGLDRLFGGDGNDFGRGGAGDDGMFGDAGNDTLNGEAGNDRFFGGTGDDNLDGSAGNDTLFGGAGFDTLTGGAGNDLLQGNFNADTFIFADGNGRDTITDFDAINPLEKIDLSGVSAIVNAFDLLSNHATQVGGNVLIDTGGGNSITLNGVSLANLDASDFIF